jgi:hypothetical protein
VSKESNEFVFVFMSDGPIFCLETLSETFVTNGQGHADLGMTAKFQLVDIKGELVLSLGENGLKGALHSARIEKAKTDEITIG